MDELKESITSDPQMVEYLKLELNQNYETFRYLDSKISKSFKFIFGIWASSGVIGSFLNWTEFLDIYLIKTIIFFIFLPLVIFSVYLAVVTIYKDLIYYKQVLLLIGMIQTTLDTHGFIISTNQWKNSNMWKYSTAFSYLLCLNLLLMFTAALVGLNLFNEFMPIKILDYIIIFVLSILHFKFLFDIRNETKEDLDFSKNMKKMAENMENNGKYGDHKRKAGLI